MFSKEYLLFRRRSHRWLKSANKILPLEAIAKLSWIIGSSEKRGFPLSDELATLRSCRNPRALQASVLEKGKTLLAFTLAETLIVMGIIGIVAALTIPNLTQSTGEKEKVAKLQKIYANLNDALGRATAVYGPLGTWFVKDGGVSDATTVRFTDRLLDFLKVSKSCNLGIAGCFKSGVDKVISGSGTTEEPAGYLQTSMILADGTAIAIYIYTNTDMTITDTSYIAVDIDGKDKGTFTKGKDLFFFRIDSKNGIYYEGTSEDASVIQNCLNKGYACTGWVIETGNMDYLKATNGTCPNGTVLNWTNTSCK